VSASRTRPTPTTTRVETRRPRSRTSSFDLDSRCTAHPPSCTDAATSSTNRYHGRLSGGALEVPDDLSVEGPQVPDHAPARVHRGGGRTLALARPIARQGPHTQRPGVAWPCSSVEESQLHWCVPPFDDTPLLRRGIVPANIGSAPRLGSLRSSRHHSRHPSWGQRLAQALVDRQESLSESKGSLFPNERVWYDQFTSTDWVHDNIADAYRVKALRSRKDFWGRVYVIYDASQGWILSGLCGFVIAVIAYVVDVAESTVFDYKEGYCAKGWWLNEKVGQIRSGWL
jgi:hypothetical protein